MVPLGHAGGLDEMLWILLPAGIFFLSYRLSQKRGKRPPSAPEGPGR